MRVLTARPDSHRLNPAGLFRLPILPGLVLLSWAIWPALAIGQQLGAESAGDTSNRAGARQQTPAVVPQSLTRVVRVGASLKAGGAGATNVHVALPVPTDWPEQHVVLFDETIPDEVRRTEYKESDTVRRLMATIPQIKGGQQLEMNVMFEVTVNAIPYPDRTDHLIKPSRPPREVRIYLSPSRNIESRKATVSKQAKSVVEGIEQPWEQARAIYDWVTTQIEIDKSLKETGAYKAIKEGTGSREDPSYAFVAMCRSQKIPARMVWADNGEYAEFYLEDGEGVGRWYPVVLEGKPEFGQMSNPRIIYQKGDNIKVPESSKRQLFVTETVRGSGKLQSVRWIRDILPARRQR